MRIRCFRLFPISVAVCILAWPGGAAAQWIADGAAVCTASGNQPYPRIAPDGLGGAIVTWGDGRVPSNMDIYAQRLDAWGNALWTADGLVVCGASGNQGGPQITADGSGGAFIAWQDSRAGNDDIYVQHIDASGNALWTTDGVAVCTATNNQQAPELVRHNQGVIVLWRDVRGGTYWDLYAQRVYASGIVAWTPDGVAVTTAPGNQAIHSIVTDGAGGIIATWEDGRYSSNDIYAQRVDASGSALWTTDGVVLCNAASSQAEPRAIPDGAGGAIVTWMDYRNTTASLWDCYAQRLDASGNGLWPANGVVVCTAPESQTHPRIVPDGSGGAVIAWQDGRSGTNQDVYAQRLNASGTGLWTADGVAVCTDVESQYYPDMVSDGAGGAVITWYDNRGATPTDVYAQRIDASGGAQWISDGLAVCTSPENQWYPQIASDGSGGAIMTWQDYRNGSLPDVYAQRIQVSGVWGWPAPRISAVQDVPFDQGGRILVQWDRSAYDVYPDGEVTDYAVWRRLPVVAAAASAHPRSGTRAIGGFTWDLVAEAPARFFDSYTALVPSHSDSTAADPAWEHFMVTARTAVPTVFYNSAVDSGYSVDNLAPGTPQGLLGAGEWNPEGLRLTWDPGPESDLAHYAVYRGQDPAFVPSPGNLLASPSDPTYFDSAWNWNSKYTYKVSALDVHDNESGFAASGPDDVTDIGDDATPHVNFLSQNAPNPFNPLTRIAYSLAGRGEVSLRVYDAAGRMVRELVAGVRGPGRYEETWDGRDYRGSRVASGVYFYRLEAGDFTSTRKMALLK